MRRVFPVKTPRIFIDKKGRWFQDGVPITHKWTYLENNRNLRRMSDGSFKVVEGDVQIPVDVEDTPFVIVSAELTDGGIAAGINDETSEVLTPETPLRVNSDNVPYARIKEGGFWARFLSGAYYAIASDAKPMPGGGFVVERAGKEYRFFPEEPRGRNF